MEIPGLLVSEVAEAAAVTIETIRFYQNEGLLPTPVRPERGYRKYSKEFVHRLRFIRSARDLGLSLSDIRDLLKATDSLESPQSSIDEIIDRKVSAIQSEMNRLECRLEVLLTLKRLVQTTDASGKRRFQKAVEVFNTWLSFSGSQSSKN